MEIKTNNYMNTFGTSTNNDFSKTNNDCKSETETETKPASNTDTITISAAGKQFIAEKKESNSTMYTAAIVSDLDSFRNAVKSMNKDLEVNWNAVVDPFGTFAGTARVESYMKQLHDPDASKNVNDMDKAADKYAQDKIDSLIQKKKAFMASQPPDYRIREADEYKMAYDAYHSENGNHLIDMMSDNMKKAYGIYKSILDGEKTSLDDEEFLMLYNNTMYRGAKSEYIRKTEEMHK